MMCIWIILMKFRNYCSKRQIIMRVCSRLKSTYVDIYSEELHLLLLKNAKDARDLRKKSEA